MPEHEGQPKEFDWRLTSFEGARREQLRCWAELPLENILLAIEEMQDLAQRLSAAPTGEPGESGSGSSVKESARAQENDRTKRVANCDEQ
ncbi:MAG: hypothetical protein KF693_00705 [Nitrospira sp.]|nr:hypothetical protein [Nitrospira sp.]